jgi:hypothetical protein
MKLTVKNTYGKGKKVKVYDHAGVEISHVKSFDTKTGEIEIYLTGIRPKFSDASKRYVLRSKIRSKPLAFKVVIVKTKIKGSYAVVDGQKVTN